MSKVSRGQDGYRDKKKDQDWLEVKMGQPRDAKKGQGWPEVKTGQPSDINEGKERPEVKTGQPQVGKKVQR